MLESRSDSASLDCCFTVENAGLVYPGLVQVEFSVQPSLSADGEYLNYGFTKWIIRIGGRGPGADCSEGLSNSHSLLTQEVSAPVAVRFTVPIAHVLVDDMGFLDNAVWTTYPADQPPTLLQIVRTVASHLHHAQTTHITPAAKEKDLAVEYAENWAAAQRHAYNKHLLADSFQQLSQHPEFLRPRAAYSDVQLANWLVPGFIAMVTSVKAALAEAVGVKDPGSSHSITALINYNHAKTAPVIRAWRAHVSEPHAGVFTFDMFTKHFCNCFIEEVALFEASALPRRRPNTMNNYGLILNDIGMYGLMSALMEEYLTPLVQLLFWEEPVAYGLDHHHSFIVQYKRSAAVFPAALTSAATETMASTIASTASAPAAATTAAALPPGDKGLDMHHDSSEVTVNVCLGREGFQGGGLRFCGMAGTSTYRRLQFTLQHVIGRAVVHLGRHRHGADDLLPPSSLAGPGTTVSALPAAASSPAIVTSERLNLIMWLRSSQFRAAAAYGHIAPDGFPKIPEAEGFVPDVCCLSKFNDPDYEQRLALASQKSGGHASH